MAFEDLEFDYWSNAERKAHKAFELYEEGQLPSALDKLQSAIEINPDNGSWHFNKALTLDALECFDEAISEYKKVIDRRVDSSYGNMLYSSAGPAMMARSLFRNVDLLALAPPPADQLAAHDRGGRGS